MPEEYLKRYARWMRGQGWTPRTRTQRLRMAERILAQWPDPGQATSPTLSEWLGGDEDSDDLSKASRATYISDVRRFFGWLYEVGLIDEDPSDTTLITRPKVSRGVPKPLSVGEEERALAAATGHLPAWLLLALRAGLRASEIAAFRGENIAEDWIIIRGKGEHEARVPTSPDLWELAQTYPRRGWWFPSWSKSGHVGGNSITVMVGKHFRRVGIDSGSIHRCRHTYATRLLQDGADLREVQELMRHASPATTQVYTAVSDDRLRAAINRLGHAS